MNLYYYNVSSNVIENKLKIYKTIINKKSNYLKYLTLYYFIYL